MEREEKIQLLKQVFTDCLELAEEAAQIIGGIPDVRDIVLEELAGNEEITDEDSAKRLVRKLLEGLADQEGEESDVEEASEAREIPYEEIPHEEVPTPRSRKEGLNLKGLFFGIPVYAWFIVGSLIIVLMAVLALPTVGQKPSRAESPTGQISPTTAISQKMAEQKASIQIAWGQVKLAMDNLAKINGDQYNRISQTHIEGKRPSEFVLKTDYWKDDKGNDTGQLNTPLSNFLKTLEEADYKGDLETAKTWATLFQVQWGLEEVTVLIEKVVGTTAIAGETEPKNVTVPTPEPVVLPTSQPGSAGSSESQSKQSQAQPTVAAPVHTKAPTETEVPTLEPTATVVAFNIPTLAPATKQPTRIPVSTQWVKAPPPTVPVGATAEFYLNNQKMSWGEAFSHLWKKWQDIVKSQPNSLWINEELAKARIISGGNLQPAIDALNLKATIPTPILQPTRIPPPTRPAPTPNPDVEIWTEAQLAEELSKSGGVCTVFGIGGVLADRPNVAQVMLPNRMLILVDTNPAKQVSASMAGKPINANGVWEIDWTW